MFIDFFYLLRSRGIGTSIPEWLDLMKAMQLGLGQESIYGFYTLCRSICVKDAKLYDSYDQCFAHYFQGVELKPEVKEEFYEWLKEAKLPKPELPSNLKDLRKFNDTDILKEFEKRLKEQKERHDGGSHWIGTGGTSHFGHSGFNESGIRVGGASHLNRAMQVASKRTFRNLRSDQTLGVRDIGLALRKLRILSSVGSHDQLDVDASIQETCKNAGEIELVFGKERRNTVKLLLLMDVGGSMTYHSMHTEQLFSAATQANHFKAFKPYFFHNCPYEFLYTDLERQETIPTMDVLRQCTKDWFLIIVGDAAMNPMELLAEGGAIDYYYHNEKPGIEWLYAIKSRFPKSVWLNPESEMSWGIHSTQLIRQVFPDMFRLSIDGIEKAIAALMDS